VWHRQVHAGYLVVTRTAPGFRAPVARLSHVAPPSTFLAAADLRARTRTIKAALGLPERVQRRLAGKRVTVDGQTLAVDTQLMLRLEKLAREPQVASLPVAEGRRALLLQTVIVGGDQPIGAVRDLPVGDRRGRLFVPSGATARGPLLVFFHGGGWVYGDLDSHDPACRFLAERSGVRVLAVDYRLAPEHPVPAAYDDAVAAYRWAVEHAPSLGADPARLGLGGDSAGGTLAATTAIAAAREGLPLAFQLLIYPGTDMTTKTESRRLFERGFYLTHEFMDLAKAHYLPDETRWADPEASPLLGEVPEGLAPAYIATAGFDPLRDEGEAYARKLADAGVAVELRRFPDQIHGFLNVVGAGRTARAATAEMAARLAAGLGVGQ
jgi:acetyl esterase